MRICRQAAELLLAIAAFSCAGPPRATLAAERAARGQQSPQAIAPSPKPTTQDAAVFVLQLMRDPDRIATSLDIDFIHLLARAQNEPACASREELALRVRTLFTSLPPRCDLSVRVDSGYTNVALPPALEGQTQEQAALIDAAIKGLQAGQEVTAFCRGTRVGSTVAQEGSADADELWLFGVNVSLQSGQWRLRAWRSFQPGSEASHGGASPFR